jgi:hypothetical protein
MRDITDPEPIWTHPKDVPPEWKKHMESRVRVPNNEMNGYTVENQHPDDHLWDCEKMQVGVLSVIGQVGDSEASMVIKEVES